MAEYRPAKYPSAIRFVSFVSTCNAKELTCLLFTKFLNSIEFKKVLEIDLDRSIFDTLD